MQTDIPLTLNLKDNNLILDNIPPIKFNAKNIPQLTTDIIHHMLIPSKIIKQLDTIIHEHLNISKLLLNNIRPTNRILSVGLTSDSNIITKNYFLNQQSKKILELSFILAYRLNIPLFVLDASQLLKCNNKELIDNLNVFVSKVNKIPHGIVVLPDSEILSYTVHVILHELSKTHSGIIFICNGTHAFPDALYDYFNFYLTDWKLTFTDLAMYVNYIFYNMDYKRYITTHNIFSRTTPEQYVNDFDIFINNLLQYNIHTIEKICNTLKKEIILDDNQTENISNLILDNNQTKNIFDLINDVGYNLFKNK